MGIPAAARYLKAHRQFSWAFVLAALLAAVIAPRAEAALFFESTWGSQGTGDGQFEGPEGIATAPLGDIYVADTANDRIQRFTASGIFIGKWGRFGDLPGRFNRPVAVALDAGGNVYVADYGNSRIQKFGPAGTFISSIGEQGSAPGQFSEPSGVAVDATGNLYVTDTGNRRIQKFDPGGSSITEWGTVANFNAPTGITLDFAGNVYVTDAGNQNVQKFDSNGASLATWGGPGSGNGQFTGPYGIAVDSEGSVYVADQGGHRVQEFTSSGSFVFATGELGSQDGQFRFPAGVAVDGADHVYVADTNNHRAQTFVTSGGAVVAVKDAQPDDSQDFSFTAGGGLSPSSFQLDDDGNPNNGTSNRRLLAADAGSGYSLSETVPSGWDLFSSSCSDGSNPSNIDVSEEEIVTCTFTNRKRGRIVVVQDSTPNDPQDFDFTTGGGLSPASFQLDDDGNVANELSNTQEINDVVSGAGYSVSQSTPAGWGTAQTSCSDGSSTSNIDVGPSELVTCTFTNRRRGSITLNLDTRPDGPQDFGFTTTGGLSPSSFQLDDDGDNGNELSNTMSFPDLSAGQYSIDQTPVSGWVQEEGDCSNGSPISDIDLAQGEDITCTVAMSTRAKIVVVKDARPNSNQDFDFTAGGGLSPSSFQLDDDAIETNALPSRRAFVVDPGSGYSVEETSVPVGWRLASATCSDGSPTTNIDVVSGEAVTCTFQNLGDSYPRPKGASPLRVSLVPAYHPCAAPNRTHGSPLAFPSCNPPVQSSTSLTIGSPDANGAAANFMGSVKLTVMRTAGGPDDSDVAITASLNDIRCRAGTTPCPAANAADGGDYAGELRMVFTLRLTDQGAGDIPATVQDTPFSATIQCAVSTSTAIGGACPTTTSADALIPGSVPEGERSIWSVGQVEVYDGGPDGAVATPSGDQAFLRQGIFVP